MRSIHAHARLLRVGPVGGEKPAALQAERGANGDVMELGVEGLGRQRRTVLAPR